MFVFGSAFHTGPLANHPTIANPLAIEAAEPLFRVLQPVSAICFPVVLICSAASIVVRFRRARGLERQQLKWLAYAVAVFAVVVALASREWTGWAVAQVAALLALGFIPVAIGIAILRYRLYDIDRVISRTLVYAVLTATLTLTYAVVVLVLGQLFGEAGGNPPSWAVAGATLAVAALFQPLRRRIQRLVDRRFNRRRYDAARTVEAFSGRLREEIDLDSLSAELLAVVDQTMQPTEASLWFRPQGSRPPPGQQGE
jgi:hypothetical protein